MRENDTVQLLLVDGKPTVVQLPASVELEVTETEPGVRGDTVSNVTKPATLETGAVVQVPMFVERGREDQGRHARGALHLAGVTTRLVDTTVRLLSQQPLAGTISTAAVLDVAEILDAAGFEALEVTGGGCFDAAVKRGTESPWERVRALKARCTQTPLQMALRGRFLVGSRAGVGRPDAAVHPVRGRERNRHLPAARPAERRREPGRGGRCGARGGRPAVRRTRLLGPDGQPRPGARKSQAARRAGCRPRAPARSRRRARSRHCGRVVARLAEEAGVPVGLYCQGESALAWRSRLPATARRRSRWRRIPLPTRSTAFPAKCCARR